jgi:hypothetical protein
MTDGDSERTEVSSDFDAVGAMNDAMKQAFDLAKKVSAAVWALQTGETIHILPDAVLQSVATGAYAYLREGGYCTVSCGGFYDGVSVRTETGETFFCPSDFVDVSDPAAEKALLEEIGHHIDGHVKEVVEG